MLILPRWTLFTKRCEFLEHWNSPKSLSSIWQHFWCLLDKVIEKIRKKHLLWFFEIIHIIRFEIWDLRSRDLKKILGYDINYLSIWPFMRHPWFPTRKASKLRFTCFQLAGEWHHPAIWKQSHGHHPPSWKQVNLSFEAFLVENQGWPMCLFWFHPFLIGRKLPNSDCPSQFFISYVKNYPNLNSDFWY